MDLAEPEFRLMSLPNKAKKYLILFMEPLHSLGLSTLSKQAKMLVKSSGLKCHYVTLLFTDHVRLRVVFFHTMYSTTTEVDITFPLWDINDVGVRVEQKETILSAMGAPRGIDREQLRPYSLRKQDATIQIWIEYILSVLNQKNIQFVHFVREDFNLDLIRNVFFGLRVKRLLFGNDLSRGFTTNVINSIVPAEKLELENVISDDEFKRISMQNFISLRPSDAQTVTFDDLLLMNAAQLTIRTEEITEKQINRIIKMWMSGSYPRLERLKLTAVPHLESLEVARIEILKGIIHQERQEALCIGYSIWFEEDFRLVNDVQPTKLVITRRDGKKAIMKVECTRTKHTFWLLVCS